MNKARKMGNKKKSEMERTKGQGQRMNRGEREMKMDHRGSKKKK